MSCVALASVGAGTLPSEEPVSPGVRQRASCTLQGANAQASTPEHDMAKGQEKPANKNKPKLTTKEKQEKKKVKKESK